jgi:hypothetical protein
MKLVSFLILCGAILTACPCRAQVTYTERIAGTNTYVTYGPYGEPDYGHRRQGGYHPAAGAGRYYDVRPTYYANPHVYRPLPGQVRMTPVGERVNRKAAIRAAQDAELRAYAESKGLPFPESPPARKRK